MSSLAMRVVLVLGVAWLVAPSAFVGQEPDTPKATDTVKPDAAKPDTPATPAAAQENPAPPKAPEISAPGDAKPPETKPAETKPADAATPKPVDAKPADPKPADPKPATPPPADAPSDATVSPLRAALKEKDAASMTVDERFNLISNSRSQDGLISKTEFEQAQKEDIDLTPRAEFAELDLDTDLQLSAGEFSAGFTNGWLIALIAIATIILPFVAGHYLAKSLRTPEYSLRMGFATLALVASVVILALAPMRFGIDLRGGVILIYQVDKEKTKERNVGGAQLSHSQTMENLVGALNMRVNPGGQKEVVIRKFGENQVEIIVPEAQPAEIEALKKDIRTAGFLEFRIMANQRNFGELLEPLGINDAAIRVELEKASKPESGDEIRFPDPVDASKVITVARWVPVDPEQIQDDQFQGQQGLIGREVDGRRQALTLVQKPLVDREMVVPGSLILNSYQTNDDTGGIAIGFRMKPQGGSELGRLTADYAPENDKQFRHRMGIVFDGRVISAPSLNSMISESGIITGGYTKQEVSSMVNILNAGSLPAVLDESPVSQYEIGATVGEDTIRKGTLAMIVATGLVLVFMAAFYRFAGLVACVVLLLNVLITLAVIVLFKAPLTLPGLAGLALGVGMAVDANVLIFERMRDELDRGAALRMAIRNGFDKASVTIIDSNLTTVITGVVLYAIGTDQVKGFAVTLIVGILANLFTAITCARLVFDVADRRRWLSKLSMSQLISGTKINFIGKRGLCVGASIVVIVIGLGAAMMRGVTLLDIDFAGGTSVNTMFKTEHSIDDLRIALADANIPEPTVSRIKHEDGDVHFKIDTGLGNESSLLREFERRDANTDGNLSLEEYIGNRKDKKRPAAWATKRFGDLDQNDDGLLGGKNNPEKLQNVDLAEESYGEFEISQEDVKYYYLEGVFEGELRHNNVTVADLGPISALPAQTSSRMPTGGAPLAASAAERLARLAFQEPPAEAPKTETPPAETPKPQAPPAETSKAEPPKTETPAADAAKTEPPKTDAPKTDAAKTEPAKTDPAVPPVTTPAASANLRSQASLTFDEAVHHDDVQSALVAIGKELFKDVRVRLTNPNNPVSTEAAATWNVQTSLAPEDARKMLDEYKADIQEAPVFPAASKIGPQVAGRAQQQAVLAIVVSLLAIIIYVWVRFQKVVYGVAAVVALAHDVLVTLGFLALSSYFAESVPALAGFMQIDPFKINLTVVAAFLTIIGFSINDTIVIFDRIREIRGKSPYLTADMVNLSVNQMLGRTFLTSFTVLLVVFILYFFGGESIHAFSFAMLVGLISGVYSTWFIATPIVLWMSQQREPVKGELRAPARAT